jgi:tyrosinase
MKFILKINGTESPKAAYVGWAPVKCTLTIDDYSGESPIPVTITTGHDGFEGRISLYNSNATSSEPIDKIEHDFKANEEITFYVAGKYQHASVGKKDTFIRVENSASEVPELTRKLMVRVRKNANELSPQEIEDFLQSFIDLNDRPPRNNYEGQYDYKPKNILDEIALMHTYDANSEIHRRTSFHPWHRLFNCHLERELQEINPSVTIPYWRFDKGANKVFTPEFIGETLNSNGGSLSERFLLAPKPKFSTNNPLFTYYTIWGALIRGYREKNPLDEKPSDNIFSQKDIVSREELVPNVYRVVGENVSSTKFKGWAYREETRSHNPTHNTFDGRVCDPGRDPVDPLFFMMHSNVDRLWALWQRKYNRLIPTDTDTYPFQGQYEGPRRPSRQPGNMDIGNFLEDTLWPWNFDHDPTRPSREWDATGDGLGKGVVPQIDLQFPNSETTDYPRVPPTLKGSIDYQGRLNNGQNLGFDYDNIPYFDHDKIDYEDEPMENIDEHNEAFLNLSLSTEERLKSANFVHFQDDRQSSLFEILQNQNEDERIRIRTIGLIDKGDELFLDIGLKIIEDDSAPANLRSELIHAVFTAKRSNRHFRSRKPEFFNILRGLIRSEPPKLRFQAMSILVESDDEIIQEFLVEEIRKGQSEFISKKDAISLLAQNIKPQHAPLFREVFETDSDPEVRKAAIEGLANDPESSDLLQKVVLDKEESFKIREAGALSLHHIDHETMNDLAADIIAEPVKSHKSFFTSSAPEPDEVDFKAGLLNMLTFTGNINRLKDNESLKTSLRQVVDPDNDNKSNFRGSFDAMTAATMDEPTIIEQMAAKLLNKFEASDEDE